MWSGSNVSFTCHINTFYLLLVGIIRETDVKHQCNKVYNGVIAVGLKQVRGSYIDAKCNACENKFEESYTLEYKTSKTHKTSETPETLVTPEQPDTPGTLDTQSPLIGTPGTHETPEKPETPGTSETPGTPVTLETPEKPQPHVKLSLSFSSSIYNCTKNNKKK